MCEVQCLGYSVCCTLWEYIVGYIVGGTVCEVQCLGYSVWGTLWGYIVGYIV